MTFEGQKNRHDGLRSLEKCELVAPTSRYAYSRRSLLPFWPLDSAIAFCLRNDWPIVAEVDQGPYRPESATPDLPYRVKMPQLTLTIYSLEHASVKIHNNKH